MYVVTPTTDILTTLIHNSSSKDQRLQKGILTLSDPKWVGFIIGKNGQTLKALTKKNKCRMYFKQNSYPPTFEMTSDNLDAFRKIKEEIDQMISSLTNRHARDDDDKSTTYANTTNSSKTAPPAATTATTANYFTSNNNIQQQHV